MASVKKVDLADGKTRWRIRVYVGRDPQTDKRKYITRTFDRKTDADREATRLERQKDKGVLAVPTRESLGEYLKRWLRDVKAGTVRARTLEGYKGYVRRYILEPSDGVPPIGSIRLDKLTPAAVQRLYAHMHRQMDLSPSTVRRLHAVVSQALDHAVKTGELARNPCDAVELPKRQQGTKKAFRAMSKAEAGRFLEAAQEDRYTALWTVLLTGGLRPGEALGLLWEDVNLEEGRIHVRRALTRRGLPDDCECEHMPEDHGDEGKGPCKESGCECEEYSRAESWRLVEPKSNRSRRVVPLPEVAVRALREWRAEQAEERLRLGAEYEDSGFVFANPFGKPLHQPNLRTRSFVPIMERARLGERDGDTFSPAFRVYDLRHTCATLLLLAGENPKVVSERLGHAKVSLTLDTYSHVLPDMQEGAVEKLNTMFGNG